MSIASEPKRPLVLSVVDIIYPIVDLLIPDYENENLDVHVQNRRRSQREHYCKELLNLRIVSRAFYYIISARLFHTLRFRHTLSSITNFLAMIQSPGIRDHVRAVRYEYRDPDPISKGHVNTHVVSERSDIVDTRQALNHALSRLHELPFLVSLSIRFGKIVTKPPERDRVREDVSSVLDALVSLSASLTRPLESLSLIRLPPIHFPQYDHPGMCSLRAHLSFFEIHCSSTVSWSWPIAPTPPRQEPMSSCEPFYCHSLPRQLLAPPSAGTGLENLESLSLCFSHDTGVYPFRYPFYEPQYHFPRLRALRLQHVQFSHYRGAEYFVAQHGDTLLELHLVHCAIAEALENVILTDPDLAVGMSEPMFPSTTEWPLMPRPWSDTYSGLAKRLGQLVYLEVTDAFQSGLPEKYTAYCPGDSQTAGFMEGHRASDIRSLEKWKQTVMDRARKLSFEYKPTFPIRDEGELICACNQQRHTFLPFD